jgi:serine/threonine-protein kinase
MARDASTLLPGEAWGHLTIRRSLGPGSRGHVYRAWDPGLGREVVLAVSSSSGDVAGRSLLHDARALAKVRHPHLAAVFGAERRGGLTGVWVEALDGDTLETTLAHVGRFNAREAAIIGMDVCEGVQAMHDAGVWHGDLSTRQVVRDRNGRVVVVPFGAGRDAVTEALPDLARPLDDPAQAFVASAGDAASAPSVAGDVLRVGALLHRLVSGRTEAGAPFRPLADIRADLPIGYLRAVERALSADSAQRHPSARALGAALATLWTPAPDARPVESSGRARRLATATALATAIVAVGIALGAWLTRQPPSPEVRFDIAPEGDAVESVAFSPDGQRLAYTSGGRLRVRALHDEKSTALEPALGARNPFFSHDGQWIYFFGGTSLWRVRVSGGAPQFVAAARRPSSGAAAPDGRILYTIENGASLVLLQADGTTRVVRRQVTGVRTGLRWPSFVVEGDQVLYSAVDARTGRRAVYLGPLAAPPDATDVEVVAEKDAMFREAQGALESNVVVQGTRLYYVRDGVLQVQRLDGRTARLVGDPRPLAAGIVTDPYDEHRVEVSVAEQGAIAYVGGVRTQRTLRVVDDDGRVVRDVAAADVRDLAVSPDGLRVAYEQLDPASGGRDIWVVSMQGGTPVRLSRHPAHDVAPTWSPDGLRVYYLSHRTPPGVLVSAPADGSGPERVLWTFDAPALPMQVTPDGRRLLFQQEGVETGWDVWMKPLDGGAPTVLVHGPASEQTPALSPDGRWLAYSSPQSEGRQVYVEPFPGDGRRWRVSKEHGRQPLWSADGSWLYYHGHERQLVRVRVDGRAAAPAFGSPEVRFPIPLRGYDLRYHYGLAGPGRVVVNVPPEEAPPVPATVILNAPLP